MANTPIFRPLPNSLRWKGKGQFLVKPVGTDIWMKGGSWTEFKYSNTIEETEVYSNEFPEKSLALVDINKAEPALAFTLNQMSDFFRRITFLSAEGLTETQEVAAAQTVDIFIGVDEVYQLPHEAVTVSSVTAGVEDYVEGTHYKVDQETGLVEILAHVTAPLAPVTRKLLTIAYDAAAVTAPVYGLMSQTDVRLSFRFLQNQKWGTQNDLFLNNVQTRPDGDVMLGADGDDFGSQAFVGRVYPDLTQPSGLELGKIRTRTTRA